MMISVENGDDLGVITVCEWLPGVKLQCMNSGVAGDGKGTNGAAAPQRQSPRGDKNVYFKLKKK
jgi:hypothetical protein